MSALLDRLEFSVALGEELAHTPRVEIDGIVYSWSPFRVATLAYKLIRAGRRLHRLAEDECNGVAREGAWDRAVDRVRKMLKPYGIEARISGDPRGAVLKLVFAKSKRNNDFGAEGYCVPR